jgi:hypothetical protein
MLATGGGFATQHFPKNSIDQHTNPSFFTNFAIPALPFFWAHTHTHPGGTALVEDNAIEELKSSSENLNTRKSTNLLVGVFRNWQAGQGQDMETYEVEELNKFTINL